MLHLPAYKIIQKVFDRKNPVFIMFSDFSNQDLVKEFSLNPYKKYFLFEDDKFSRDGSKIVIFVGDYSSLKTLKYSSKTEARRDIQERYKNVLLDYEDMQKWFWWTLYFGYFNENKMFIESFWNNLNFNNVQKSLNLLFNENIPHVTRKNTQEYKHFLVTLKKIKDRLNELDSALKRPNISFRAYPKHFKAF
tara:strand:- start:835 stop:1410 length:576 start_codon:yes stop_codon:yes gene_type:complete